MNVSTSVTSPPPADDLQALLTAAQAQLIERDEQLAAARSELAAAHARCSNDQALIAHMKLVIARMRRDKYGTKSERSARLLDQIELQLEDLEASATEDDIAAEQAAAKTTGVTAFQRKRPVRKPFPAHLPRERIVIPGPGSCACCGGTRLSKLGEDITETLEVIPRQWKVIQTVRERFSCRDCETIGQAPAPFHVIPRGFMGPNAVAMILFEKFGQHQPLNRQSTRYAHEGVDLSISTLADLVGTCSSVLRSVFDLIEARVLAAERLHADETTVPVLAKGKTITGYLWTYVRDDRPFGGKDPPAAVFYYSRGRDGEYAREHLAHYGGILQVDAYAGYSQLFTTERLSSPLTAGFCWAHARRPFFELADLQAAARRRAQGKEADISPLALEAVRRIDALFAIERDINGRSADERRVVREHLSAPLVEDLHRWLHEHRSQLSDHAAVAKAMTYMLKRWDGFTQFLRDGRICLTNNAAERALRQIAIGRRNWLFCGSDRGGQRAALIYSLITTCRMNEVDPQAWLADVLARIADHPVHKLDQLLPWNWRQDRRPDQAAA